MTDDIFKPNQMGVLIDCHEDGEIAVCVGHDLDEDFDEEMAEFYLNLLMGMNLFLKHHPTVFVAHGAMFREMKNIWGDEFDEDELDIEFEPDQELIDAINPGSNVIQFNKKRMH